MFAIARLLLCLQLNVSADNPPINEFQSTASVVLRTGLATSIIDRRVIRV